MMNVESKIISREISPLLWKAGETVCTAESCTSGQISAAITSVPGSSTYFKGGIVCYTNCLLYTSPSPRDGLLSRMPSSA